MAQPSLRSQITVGITLYALILIGGLGVLTALFADLSLRELRALLLIGIGEAIAIAVLAGAILARRLVQREAVLQALIAEATDALTRTVVELRGERDRLADALRGSRLAIWEMDVLTGAIRLSIEWSRMMGEPENETFTTLEALRSRVPAEEQPGLEQSIFAALKGERAVYDVDHRCRRRDGTFVWIRSRGMVTRRDADGRALAMAGTNSEIGRRKSAEAAASDSEAKLRLVADNVPVMMSLIDSDYRYVYANRRYLDFFGDDVVGRTLAEVVGAEGEAVSKAHMREIEAGAPAVTYERERHDRHGALRHLEVRLVPYVNAEGRIAGHFTLVDDVTERRAESRVLAESAAELKLVMDGVATLIARFDLDGRILFANRRCHEFFAVAPEGAIGQKIGDVMGRVAEEKFLARVKALRRGEEVAYEHDGEIRGQSYHLEVHLVPHRNAAGDVDSAYVLITDITSRKLVERLLEQEALTDPLTRLPNRRHFGERLAQAIAQARRQSSGLALLFLDLDGFKDINDRLGHAAGDSLLKDVAARVLACVRAADTVGRIGGDEFVVLLEANRSTGDAEFVAGKLIGALGVPFHLTEGEASITCSVGIALYPADGEDSKALLRHADLAMYRAKRAGKNRFEHWTD